MNFRLYIITIALMLSVRTGLSAAATPTPDPNRVVLTLLTPVDSLCAGDTIRIEERLYNQDGLAPRLWCGQAVYRNIFDNNKKPQWVPTITIPSFTKDTVLTFGEIGGMCFQNGIDTIKVVLYNAPFTQDTLHQISIELVSGGNNLHASTNPFVLKPGRLDSISIEDANYVAIPGPVTLNYPGGMQFFYSLGYDHYQNLIGHYSTNWTQTETLHPIPPPTDSIFRIFYEAADADEEGWIVARTQSLRWPYLIISDSVRVINNGSPAVLDSAVTKDLNGNGYLDHVYLYFNKPLAWNLTGGLANTTLRYATTLLPIDSISSGNSDRKMYILNLRDTQRTDNGIVTTNAPPPQTAWRPILTINNLPNSAKVVNLKCKDGAGPVIWRVSISRNNGIDRTKDLVEVMFSEAVKSGKTADNFTVNSAPPCSVFNVWSKVNGSLTKLEGALSGIRTFYAAPDSITLSFYMTNGQELSGNCFFNIISHDTSCFIFDKAYLSKSNLPGQNNQKVQVLIFNTSATFDSQKKLWFAPISGNVTLTTYSLKGETLVRKKIEVQPGKLLSLRQFLRENRKLSTSQIRLIQIKSEGTNIPLLHVLAIH